MKVTFDLFDRFLCPDCGKEHLSSDKNCSFCGKDLADLIVDYEAKHLPIAYKKKVSKVPSKTSKRIINYLTSLIVIAIVAASVLYGVNPEIYGGSEVGILNLIMVIISLSILFLIFLINSSVFYH